MVAESIRDRLRSLLVDGKVDMQGLRALAASGIEPDDGGGAIPVTLTRRVPLINKVAAGYPSDFTDLGYPARVAAEYITVQECDDPDLFAARVCGDSMMPEFSDGDIIVMSPRAKFRPGMACFCRFEDGRSTFKSVYTEDDGDGLQRLRLRPLNPAFPERAYPREDLAGVYPVLFHTRVVRA